MRYMDLHDLPRIGNWLMDGDTGQSSLTMAAVYMTGTPKKISHPLDPSDFNRCMLFLRDCVNPDKHFPLIVSLSNLSPEWDKIRAHWGELTMMYHNGVYQGRAEDLYAKMKEIGL